MNLDSINTNSPNQETNAAETATLAVIQNALLPNNPITSQTSLFRLNNSMQESLIISLNSLTQNKVLQTFVQCPSNEKAVTSQPRILREISASTSANNKSNQPQSLFLQSLAKLNQTSQIIFNFNSTENLQQSIRTCPVQNVNTSTNPTLPNESPELSAPNSLTSAPPSYSFVLRQINSRRRPRFMGTFIPSPSFVHHIPPPNYDQAFDIYIDNAIPPPPPRSYNFGFHPMLAVCPECGFAGSTIITAKITFCTHLCAIILCMCSCWLCVPLPYLLSSCKDVYHYCGNCRHLLGTYCPTNPQVV